LENRRANKSCPGGRAGTSGSGGTMRKGGRRVTVQKMCTHARKWESDTCWNYSRNQKRGMKENGRRGKFMYIWYIVRTHVNITMYPSSITTMKKKKTDHFVKKRVRGWGVRWFGRG
jgi:hypothetical protein